MKIINHRDQSSVFRSISFPVIVLVVTCFTAQPVFAQIMSMFTSPIGSKQLMKYADRVELTVEQRLALEPMHDSYLQLFGALQDEDMQEFVDILYDTMVGVARSGFSIPQRSALEAIVREFLKIEKKIAAIDKSLFNEIESLLDENQHNRLERVRKQRRIDALRSIVLGIGGEFNEGAQVDLTHLVAGLDLTSKEIEFVDPILISYESTLLAKARKLHSALKDATTTILDAIDDMGLRDLPPEELMQLGNDEEFQLSVQEMFNEASVDFQEATFELSQHNLKNLRKLFQYLEPQNKEDLRDRYYRSAYRRVLDHASAWRRRFDDALKLQSLPPELVEPITQSRDTIKKQQDTVIDKLVDVIEKSREFRTMEIMNDGESGPYDNEIEELQGVSEAMAKRAIVELESLLGPELLAELKNEKEAQNIAQQQMVEVVTDRRGRPVMQESLADGTSSHADRKQKDEHFPDPLSPSDFQQFVTMLEFEIEDKFVVDTLYQEYRDNYDNVLYKSVQGKINENTDKQTEDAANPVNEDDIRQQSIDELHKIDKRLFDDVALITKSQEQDNIQQRFRLLRTRANYRHRIEANSPSWRDEQTKVDLIHLLLNTQIDGLEISSLDAAFKSYESQTLPLLTVRLEITKKLKKRMDAMQRANQANASTAVSQAMREKWQEIQQTLAKNHLQISQVSEEHLEKIKSQLPAHVAQQLQYSYNEIVYPRMFRASRNVDSTIEAALAMPNISDTQQNQIDAIADTFHYKYMSLAEQGIKLQRQSDNDRSGFSMGFPSHEMVMREVSKERLEFERNEACDRAIMLIQLTLGETQRQALQEISKW